MTVGKTKVAYGTFEYGVVADDLKRLPRLEIIDGFGYLYQRKWTARAIDIQA